MKPRISRIKAFDKINVAVQFIALVIAVRFIAQINTWHKLRYSTRYSL